MNANTKVNLQQITSIKNAPIMTPKAFEILNKREAIARREIASLRKFASYKAGHVADHCNSLANEIEAAI